MRRTLLLAVTALLLAATAPAQGQAPPFGFPYPRAQVPQGVGCYWYRGNLNCSRYCYWEIDGYRYCTRRLRNAYSQAPEVFGGYPPYAPYAPQRRPRPAK